jgi:uracil-DNA glycosylase
MQKLGAEFQSPYMLELKAFLLSRANARAQVYPKGKEIFTAFHETTFDRVKVVVIGQDPYHGPGQAHGLSFSVKPGIAIPPSLMNIYKELATDIGMERPTHGHLLDWARQGVLLLNAVLTVEDGSPGAHAGKGWEKFTDKAVEVLNLHRENLVFFLWGAYAQRKGVGIDRDRHLVIESAHPSPLSAHRGFLGSRPFSRANEYLSSKGVQPIEWRIV